MTASRVTGTLFLTPEQLVFATYDTEADSFVQFYSANYSNITWISPRLLGASIIIRIRHDKSVHSFSYGHWGYKNNGEDADRDEVVNFILDKFKK